MYLRRAVRIKVGDDVRRNPASADMLIRRALERRGVSVTAEGRYCFCGPTARLGPQEPPTRCVAASVRVTPEELRMLHNAQDPSFQIAANPSIAPLSIWTSAAPGGGIFGNRAMALTTLAAARDEALGAGVNVAIVDFGIDSRWLRAYRGGRSIAGGWARLVRPDGPTGPEYKSPGSLPPTEHGHMIARNILSVAPAARIFDVPLLPETTLGPPGIADAEGMFERMLREIKARKQDAIPGVAGDTELPDGPWILCNAWGVLDPFRHDPDAEYWNNPHHPFLAAMPRFTEAGIDVVFAAGNCGLPGAQPRCAEMASGPGASIHGVNAHPDVLTVGAVRVDGLPIGSSALGPGVMAGQISPAPPRPASTDYGLESWFAKPDVSAPSYFRDTDDAMLVNTGTSAACGLTVGVLAALRGLELAHGRRKLSPATMRGMLRRTARRPQGAGWDPRQGWGIVNLGAARAAIDCPILATSLTDAGS
ncbi:S8 family serine peptidase [Paracraurococcus lichenis]|uniref:S8 family serine peptidase n=1 Tax=Paracraurococcus lichenis TaxID=3064888 RepID=A0ABT9EBR2_9PROT|nr:S8 family serine peptidase [Paracraurococcus sp. LOR1-02]MDO9713480.1 S8 family serine peptidase [Paracraurococcus sp. LOR1-02]